jgi:SAM-dependent methyltransferase
MTEPGYRALQAHYEACLAEHGDTARGVNWANEADAELRHAVMRELLPPKGEGRISVLDFGCGTSHFYEHLLQHGRTDVDYIGLDISERFVAVSREKFPQNRYVVMDALAEDATLPEADYVVMNGVFTNRTGMSEDAMMDFFERLVAKVFPAARRAIAFNAMTKHGDWERVDLFHLPFDTLAAYLKRAVSRRFVIRNDYGLYDYTAYVYH